MLNIPSVRNLPTGPSGHILLRSGSRAFRKERSQLHKIPPFPSPFLFFIFLSFSLTPSFCLLLLLLPYFLLSLPFPFPFAHSSSSLFLFTPFPLPVLSPKFSQEVRGSAVSFPSGVRGIVSHCCKS